MLPFRIALLIAACLFAGMQGLRAQYPVLEKKMRWPADSIIRLDSLTPLLPTLRNPEDSGMRFQLDFPSNQLKIIRYARRSDSIRLRYAAFPFPINKPFYRFPPASFDSLLGFADYPGRRIPLAEKRDELFSLPGIQKSGVISRGLSLSNGQNGFVNSSMNLQLDGMLPGDIRLTALLSDQSLPFQPEGNTSQIRELDRIFIRLEHQKAELLAGDVLLKANGASSFFRLYRNIQGAELKIHADSSGRSLTRIAAGIAKGKFASVVVAVREGVQGPYRLRPPDNPELIFVILAGSERIWLDGRLLKRGFNQDYVIDYNTGEITLNNNQLLTRFTRLRCDFEYAERNYSRSSLLAEHQEQFGRLKIQAGHYQEQDNPFRPLGFTLDSANLSMLQLAGDRPQSAFLSGISPVEPEKRIAGNLYYEQRDTLLNGSSFRYFAPATANASQVFQLTFSETQPAQGDYLLFANLGNGKRFQFVGPGRGNYRIGKPAVLPDKKSMSRSAMELDLGKRHVLDAEAVLSIQDANRLSSLDESNNAGNAQRLGWRWNSKNPAEGRIKSHAAAALTRLSRNFRGIDRFRDIEFERNWNGQSGDTLSAEDLLLETQFASESAQKWNFSLQSNWRQKGQNVRGYQHTLDWNQNAGFVRVENQAYFMENQRSNGRASWRRLCSRIIRRGGKIQPFYRFQLDENEIRDFRNEVSATAMHFRAHSFGLRSADSGRSHLSAAYTYREDRSPGGTQMNRSLFSHNAEISAALLPGGNHQLELSGNYRLTNPVFAGKNEENLSARMDYRGSAGDGFLRQELVLTANTGQEARRSFQFIKSNAAGEGSHKWIDYNGNGLQELDEFVEALRPEDRQYIKIFTPTSEFIPAYTRSLNYRLHLGSPAAWQNRKGIQKLISRFVLLSSLNEDRRLTGGSLIERYLPLTGEDGDQVISAARVIRKTLFFNRSRPDFGAELSSLNSLSKILLSNGFSRREGKEFRVLIRKNIGSNFNLSLRFLQFRRNLQSDALAGQNFRLNGIETGPELAWQPGISHRVSGQFLVSDKQNGNGEDQARISQAILDYRSGMAGKRNLNAQLRYSEIRFRGNVQSAAAYELLEGLLPGRNFTWSVNIQQKLTQGLQLLLTYEGRKSENQRIVHLGKVQASLLF